jgi:hypothetical protein
MQLNLLEIENCAHGTLVANGHAAIATRASQDCAWLEAVGYPGLQLLAEAVGDKTDHAALEKDLMGLDLQNISSVFLADEILKIYSEHGRIFLRNVRHGLYVLPMSVRGNFGIGCPVDPAFALGGERLKNPYAEKIEIATRDGVTVDDAVWRSLQP